MPAYVQPHAKSERILGWYALVQQVYELAHATPTSTAEQSTSWTSVLEKAAVYFGLDALEHCQGRPPSPPEPGQMVFPLPPWRAVASQFWDCVPRRLTDVRLFETHAHYLRARPGPSASSAETLRPQVQRFIRHVVRCMQIQESLAAAQQSLDALYDTLDRQDLAVVLCDAQGRARFSNRSATRLRARYPELQLDPLTPGWMQGAQQPLSQLFQQFRQNLRVGENRAIRLSTDALLYTLVPLLSHTTRAAFATDGPSLGLIVQEQALRDRQASEGQAVVPEVPDALSRRLQDRFALTPAEARLSYGLCFGLSVAGYAALAQRSPLTVRKQLKSIYRKMKVHDQKTLILRVWQEQKADWLHCVRLMAAPDKSPASPPALVYPQPHPTNAGTQASVPAPYPALLPEEGCVHG